MRKRKLFLGLIWLLLAIILPLPLIYVLNTGLIDTPNHLVAYDFGILAYVWWLAIVYLSTRPQWIAKGIGIPSTYMMHGLLGVFALIAATIHKFSATSFHAIIRNTGNTAWILAVVMIVYAVIFLSGWLTDRASGLRKIKTKLERIFHHQLSIWIHRLNLVIIALIWVHVNVIPRIANVPNFILIFDLYTLIFLAFYVYKKFIIDADMNNGGIVAENLPLTSNVQKIKITLNQKAKQYHAGDFYFISFKSKKISGESHPFSVMSKPNKNDLTLMIHKVGDFTSQIEQIEPGTKVHLDGPYGLFNDEVKNENRPIILYALGTGIAPLISLAKEHAGKKQIHLIWSTASKENYLQNDINQLKNKNVVINEKQHRYKLAELQQILTDQEKKQGQFFIVGSAPVVIDIRRLLKSLGIKSDQLHDEHLTM